MKITAFFLFLGIFFTYAEDGYSQGTKLTLNLRSATIREVCKQIENQSNYIFVFSDNAENELNKKINVSASSENIEEILNDVFSSTGLTYKILDKQVVVYHDNEKKSEVVVAPSPTPQPEQTKTITGKVTDSSGEPLPGATVMVKGTTIGTVTDADGNFSLRIPMNAQTLLVSFVGMKTQEIPIGNRTTFNVALEEEATGLQEVVVTALGITRQAKALSYAQSSVDAETMSEVRSPNFISSLSGKVAGVQIVPPGFNTGSSRIVIRGNSSLTGNNQPLFVIDGVPVENTIGEEGQIDYGSGAANLNPEDIENIEILKGPNASALYGSRAANGVILITTKKGTSEFKVTVNSNSMFQTITEFPEYQNAYGVGTSFYIDRTHMLPEAAVNYRSWGSPMLGQPYVAINGEIKPYLPVPDNVEDFYQTAHLFTNSIALEGGSQNHIMRFSYTNYIGTSVVDKLNENIKHNLSISLQNKFNQWLSFDTKVTYIKDQVDNRQYSNDSRRNPTYSYVHMARSTDLSELIPWKDELTGEEIGTHRNFPNPYWIINENKNEDTKDQLIASFSPQFKITDWFNITGRLGAQMYWFNGHEFNNPGSKIAGNPDGYLRTFDRKEQNINLEVIGSINKNINDFSFLANFGGSRFDRVYENREVEVNSLLQPDLINLSNAKEYPSVSQQVRKKRINSLFGAISIGYKDFAYLDITGRNDWSSTLPSQNNSYFYPSIGGSLIFSELFKVKDDFLSFGKLRASYAIVGNDTDPYSLEQTFSFDGFFNESPYASISTTMNDPALKPEETTSYEIGADLRFFNNRLSVDATYYNSSTVNQIVSASLPHSSGYNKRFFNAGKIKNWGFETSVTGKIIDNKDFLWESQINFSQNNSLVAELVEGIPRFELGKYSSYIFVYAEEGKPYAYLRGLGVKRDEQGRMLLEEGGGLLQKDTDMPFGTASPDWLAGFGNTLKYKNFDLYVLFDIKKGGVLYSRTISQMLTNGMLAETLYGRDDYYLRTVIWGESDSELTGGARWDAWYEDGTPNTRYMSPQSYEYARPNFAEFVTYDASYVKLRELSMGYNFPKTILSSTPLETVRISVVGRNLWTFYKNTPQGLDPESSATAGNAQGIERGSLPPNATYGFNIRLIF